MTNFQELFSSRQYVKFTKVECSTSNNSCTNLYCRVKPIARKVTFFNLQCLLPRALKNIALSFSAHHKPLIGGNFVQILSFKNINLCEVSRSNNPILKSLINYANDTLLNGALQLSCPYGPGMFRITNATYSTGDGLPKHGIQQTFPNGQYRIDAKLANKKDDNIASVSLFFINQWRIATLNSDDKF